MDTTEIKEPYDSAQDALAHIAHVQANMSTIINELLKRADNHDQSKLYSPEKETYDKYIPMLKETKYGSQEYFDIKMKMEKEGLKHHFEANRHHPEHFKNKIDDMNLVDVLEMFIDWYSASLRSDTGFEKGLAVNIKKFNISPQLASIINNTFEDFFK